MKNIVKILGSSLALSLLLSACGGGGGDDGGGGSPSEPVSTVLTDAQVVAYVKSSNIDYVPNGNGRPAGTWRWSNTPSQPVVVYIPTPTNATEQDYAAKVNTAISTYNTKLSSYLVLEATSTLPTTGNYIQVSYGTAWIPPGGTDYNSYCANISSVIASSSSVVPNNQNNIVSPVYLNLGNGKCNLTQDIATHEFAHALGLGYHFYVFGSNKADNFWDVLATLYGNPVSTTAENLLVRRAR